MKFFNNLNFTSSNEDGRTELAALCDVPHNRLVCITASGTRPLDLLLGSSEEIISLDMNPAQNELLRLKMAAFSVLDYPQLLEYLGILPSDERMKFHSIVEAKLPIESKTFWSERCKLIHKGIWYCGLWERVLKFGAFGNSLFRGKKIDLLFDAETLDEQSHIWQRYFDDYFWRQSIRLLGKKWIWTKVIGEPGGAFLPSSNQIEKELASAFNKAAKNFFFRDSDFASLILRGKHDSQQGLPVHLEEKNFETVRSNLHKIKIVDGGLTEMEKLNIRDVNAFSLSDFGSYCNQEAYDSCWNSIIQAAAPNAKYCEREFLNTIKPSRAKLVLDEKVSALLRNKDRAFIYKIRAGHIPDQASPTEGS